MADNHAHFTQLDQWESTISYYRNRSSEYLHLFNSDIKDVALCLMQPNGWAHPVFMGGKEGVHAIKEALQHMAEYCNAEALKLEDTMSKFFQANPGIQLDYYANRTVPAENAG